MHKFIFIVCLTIYVSIHHKEWILLKQKWYKLCVCKNTKYYTIIQRKQKSRTEEKKSNSNHAILLYKIPSHSLHILFTFVLKLLELQRTLNEFRFNHFYHTIFFSVVVVVFWLIYVVLTLFMTLFSLKKWVEFLFIYYSVGWLVWLYNYCKQNPPIFVQLHFF